MKKSDISIIVVIAVTSVIVAFFVGRAIFGDTYSGSATVKTIDRIDSTIVEPSADVFNKNAINPTVQVNVTGTDSTTNSSTTTPGA